jgi:hypothetical protein
MTELFDEFQAASRRALAKATKYRALARSVTDRETVGRIWDLTIDLEKQAGQIARMLNEQDIRTRAHQI